MGRGTPLVSSLLAMVRALLVCVLIQGNTAFATLDFGPSSCQNLVADEGKLVSAPSEVTRSASVLLDEIRQTCSNPSACSDDQLQAVMAKSLQKRSGGAWSALKKLMKLPRRALVFLIWGGSILGPGVLSYYATSGVPDGLRISFSSFVMVMSGVLFGRFSGPIEKKLGPLVEQLAFHMWDPNTNDAWGQIMKNLNEADRLKYSQMINQMLILRAYFEHAGKALEDGDLEKSARHYVDAILNSYDLFAALNLTDVTTIREMRLHIPDVDKMPDGIKWEILKHAHDRVVNLSEDEISKGTDKNELRKIVDNSIHAWFRF